MFCKNIPVLQHLRKIIGSVYITTMVLDTSEQHYVQYNLFAECGERYL